MSVPIAPVMPSEVGEAIGQTIADEVAGFALFLDLLSRAERRNNEREFHLVCDGFLPMMISRKAMLPLAEHLATRLVAMLPDRTHLGLLSQIYELQGKLGDAQDAQARSDACEIEHHQH